MNVLWHWLPTIGAAVILLIAGLILMFQVEREERRAKQNQTDKPTKSPA
jgi:hypothetical protein